MPTKGTVMMMGRAPTVYTITLWGKVSEQTGFRKGLGCRRSGEGGGEGGQDCGCRMRGE